MKKVFVFLCAFFVLGATQGYSAATSDQYLNAGNTLYQQKNYSRAILYYKAAIQVDPGNAAAHTRLANTYYMLGQKSDALVEYKAALAINPGNTQLSAFVEKLQAQVNAAAAPGYVYTKPTYQIVKPMEIDVYLGVASGGYGSSLGIGGGGALYFPAGNNLWLGGSLGVYDFSYSTSTTALLDYEGDSETETYSDTLLAIELLASGKLYLDTTGIKPYLVGGVGLSMLMLSESSAYTYSGPYAADYQTYYGNSSTKTSASATNPMAQAGAGLSLSLGTGLDGFAEVKYSLVVSSGGSASYIPIDIGLSF